MARPARFTTDDLLDAAATALTERGPAVTVADVGRVAGAPSGSIYHRFSSREELMARLWLRSIRRFHEGQLEAYAIEDTDAAIAAIARHVITHCRERPAEALAMTLYRAKTLATSGPEATRDEAAHVNDALDAATLTLARRRWGRATHRRLEALQVATRLAPYGMVRQFVGGEVPTLLDDAAAAAALAIVALADEP